MSKVLLLGDPLLKKKSEPVTDFQDPRFVDEQQQLQEQLELFRRTHGFGRAIAAPQMGIHRRMIALNLNGNRFVAINPEITWRSDDMFTMWDDCMSFPHLLVRLERHSSVSVRYQDSSGRWQEMNRLARDVAELLQHEIDHLDGVLAVDRALDDEAIIERHIFEAFPAKFLKDVSYAPSLNSP